MVIPHFIFKNKNSIDFGIIVNTLPPIQTVDEEFEYIEVPGRNGYLTISTNRKPTLEKTIVISMPPSANISSIKRWLSGSGELILSNDPDVFYIARIQTIRNLKEVAKDGKTSLIFSCQPEAYLHTGDNIKTITISNTKIYNSEDESYPLIKIYGDGPVSLYVNSTIQEFDDVDEYVEIDSKLMETYKDNSYVTFTGDFPTLIPGENNISWDGTVTNIEVTPRWQR